MHRIPPTTDIYVGLVRSEHRPTTPACGIGRLAHRTLRSEGRQWNPVFKGRRMPHQSLPKKDDGHLVTLASGRVKYSLMVPFK